MDSTDFGQAAYLILLLVAIGGWMVASNRGRLGHMTQQAAVWGFIFLGTIAAVGLWGDISRTVMPQATVLDGGMRIVVPQGSDGHYHLTMDLNDVPVDFIVDTGASDLVLSKQDAERIGIDPSTLAFAGVASTANGAVRTARARIGTVTLGNHVERDVPAEVSGGQMPGSLLGMTYLQRFARIEIADNRMILTR